MLTRRLTLIVLLAVSMLAAQTSPLLTTAIAGERTAQSDDGRMDRLVLRSGRVVEGRILSESASEVKMLVIVAGIEAPVTYARSEILEIQKDIVVDDAVKTPASRRTAEVVDDEDINTHKPDTKGDDTGASKVYVLPLNGLLIGSIALTERPNNTMLSVTPIKKALADAVSYEPDVIVVKMKMQSVGGAAGVFVAEDIGPLFETIIDDGVRVVFWVDEAMGGAGLLPFVSPEIYFTSEGRMGGLGGIGETDSGDSMVDQKLISAYIGHAEGFAIKGGYDPHLIPAMARQEEWLAVRFRNGEPEYITWEPREQDGEGWTILTDDGEGANKDEFSFEGNDVLNLDAEMSQRLRVSKGTVDELDDLIYELGLNRDYTVIDGRGKSIIKEWDTRLANAIEQVQLLLEEYGSLSQRGSGRGKDAARKIGRQISVLKKIRSLLTTWAEALDPSGQQRAQIDVTIDKLRLAIQRAKKGRSTSNNRTNRPGMRPF